MTRPPSPRHAQQGAALIVALSVALVLMLMGASAVRIAIHAEKSSRGERDRQVALLAAEAALDDAGHDIEGGADPGSPRAGLFAPGSSEGFGAACGAGLDNPALGLCLRTPDVPAWQGTDLRAEGSDAATVEYGRFTGAVMAVGAGALPARLPRYIIELMPYARAGHDAATPGANFYRITAIGFGASERHCVVLQAYYLKAGVAS